jgi:hypothetical protein
MEHKELSIHRRRIRGALEQCCEEGLRVLWLERVLTIGVQSYV